MLAFPLPEPPQPPTELDVFASTHFSPPPFFSSLYNLSIMPDHPFSSNATPSSWISPSHSGLFHSPCLPYTTAMTEEPITTSLSLLYLLTPTVSQPLSPPHPSSPHPLSPLCPLSPTHYHLPTHHHPTHYHLSTHCHPTHYHLPAHCHPPIITSF